MQLGTRRLVVRLGLSLLVAGAFVWWLGNQGIEIVPSAESFRTLAAWAVPLYLLVLCGVHFLRAYRWVYLLRPIADVPVRKALPVAFVGFLAILMLPLRMGELARPLLLKRHAGVSMSAALGTIAIERVIDGLLVSLWLTICLFGIPASRSPYIWPLRLLPLGLFVAALLFLVLFLAKGDWVTRVAGRISGRISKKLSATVVHVMDGFGKGLSALPNKTALLQFLAMSIAYWALNAFGIWLLAAGVGIHFGATGAVALMGVVAVGILLPSGPGFFGNFQAAALVALGLYVPAQASGPEASVYIFTIYAVQVTFTLLVGLGSVALSGLSLRGIVSSDLPKVAEDFSDWA